jgi:hypothetical protein
LDYALFNSAPISAEMVERYAAEKAVALDPPIAEDSASNESGAIQFISLPLISESRSVRHAPEKLSKAIFNIYSRGWVSPPQACARESAGEISTASGSERGLQ